MTEAEPEQPEEPKKKSKLPLLLGVLLLLVGAGGGFYAVNSGLLPGGDSFVENHAKVEPDDIKDMPDVSYVALDPLVVSFGDGRGPNLRFRAQLEVHAPYHDEVAKVSPRVMDVLNSYLRAVDLEDLRSNSALVKLRAQMLRRIQVVTGGNRVNDLLIMEFVLN
ncbi:flagellar basal body-associated FliL family protein [Roseovarius phycicola]|uniref:Flagellar protein FliL n=1 Tax=Roseovarius phycicola TaxID=3080976 RepID=A0ABZ2HFL7_9RHOB